MDINAFLTRDRVLLDMRSRDKPRLLADIAQTFARLVPTLQPEAVEAALTAREQLGSTGLGSGFALPHARMESIPDYLGLFVRLARPMEFAAIDGKPVQFVFTVLIPMNSAVPHVAVLAAISRRFRDPALVAQLRTADTPEAAHALLKNVRSASVPGP